jgi:hypothetical protein
MSVLEPKYSSGDYFTRGRGHTTASATPVSITVSTSARNTRSRVDVSRGIICAVGFVNAVVLQVSV